MTRKVLRVAALVAALGVLLALAPAATVYAAPRHDAAIAEESSTGIWASLAELWERLIGVVSGGSGCEGDSDGSGASAEDGGSDTSSTDGSPGVDPNG